MFNRINEKVKTFFTRKSRIGQLEDEVADMKARIFKKESESIMVGLNTRLSSWFTDGFTGFETKPLEEDFFDNLEEIENRLDLLARHIGVKFVRIPKADEHLSLKSTRVRKTKKNK